MNPTVLDILGAIFFLLAVLHTFLVGKISSWAALYPKNSLRNNILHLCSEVEIVFALWAAFFMLLFIGLKGWSAAISYQNSLHFLEPFFVFVIMVVCSTRPILTVARKLIISCSSTVQKILRTPAVHTDISVTLILGSLVGSFITEPAAMTVTAFMLNSILQKDSSKLPYAILAVLFVNISIGGSLTPFAAPPILMVAKKWDWDFFFVLSHFGWKSALAVFINSLGFVFFFKKEIAESCWDLKFIQTRLGKSHSEIPLVVLGVHLIFLLGIVVTSHHQNAFLGIFLLFLGVTTVFQKYHDSLRLKESLLVAMFLGGIIQFGEFQKWWLTPLLASLSESLLFAGAVGLTAVTDNAALTYLGSQVAGLSASSQYALVAGAISGGGLTIIANAPNAAGFSILSHRFQDGLKPIRLFFMALIPTAVAIICLWLF